MDVRRAIAALVLAAGAVSCDAPTVPTESTAYEFRLSLSQGLTVYHWPLGASIAVFVDTVGSPDDRDLNEAVRQAFDSWTAAVRYGEFSFHTVASPQQADVTIHFDTDSVVSVPCGFPIGASGVTNFCLTAQEDEFVALPLLAGGPSHVVFDVQISSDSFRIATQEKFRAVVAHEFGHVLGIGRHSPEPTDLMFGSPPESLAGPTARDAQTLRFLLHQPAGLEPRA